jgi:hypothetical protein
LTGDDGVEKVGKVGDSTLDSDDFPFPQFWVKWARVIVTKFKFEFEVPTGGAGAEKEGEVGDSTGECDNLPSVPYGVVKGGRVIVTKFEFDLVTGGAGAKRVVGVGDSTGEGDYQCFL